MTKRDLAKLKAIWNKKLAASGFKDIEHPTQDNLLKWDSAYFANRYTPASFEENRRYYELAGQMLHTFKFKKPVHKQVWKYHSEGLTNALIAEKVKMHETSIDEIVHRLQRFIKS